MYQLTCPTCSTALTSPFVRSGAVVRCIQCEHKYRIKSSHLLRQVQTGPKTLDELDPLLRGDSVDLDPEQSPAPVYIDDEGHVVGLSGLSELMRKSDADLSRADALARANAAANTAPPVARVTRPLAPAQATRTPSSGALARANARRRRSRNNAIMGVAAAAAVLAIGVTVYAVMMGGKGTPEIVDKNNINDSDDNPNPHQPASTDPKSNPSTTTPTTHPDDPSWLTGEGLAFEINEHYRYTPAAQLPKPATRPPADTPVFLTPASAMTHEGWYILNPPRDNVETDRPAEIELLGLDATATENRTVTLQGSLTNHSSQILLSGEAHIELIDALGQVFAETYLALHIIEPSQSYPIQLELPERFWTQSQRVQTRITPFESADSRHTLEHIQVRAVGQGTSTNLRITAPNPNHPFDTIAQSPDTNDPGSDWQGGLLIDIWADDSAGNTVARFRAELNHLELPAGQWLDFAVHTPVPDGQSNLNWHTTLEAY